MPFSHTPSAEDYTTQLTEKFDRTTLELAPYYSGEIEQFASPKEQYRMRAEFKMWHDGDNLDYAMYQPGTNKKTYVVNQFPAGTEQIQALMPSLLDEIKDSDVLRRKLFQVEFLTSLKGEALITLIYHRPLAEDWNEAAQQLAKTLKCQIIGRSRKQKITLENDYILETFRVGDNAYTYQQVEASFTQPNGAVCEKMLNWVFDNIVPSTTDLLELYCGNGNFTLPLSRKFRKVLATEISKSSIQSALFNCALNAISNIDFLRMSSEEFTQALNGERTFRRLQSIDLDNYSFGHVLVDPPRAGLDHGTLSLISQFPNIIYISCNPDTLVRDLEILSQTHTVKKAALFDQFPFTEHRECGVILEQV